MFLPFAVISVLSIWLIYLAYLGLVVLTALVGYVMVVRSGGASTSVKSGMDLLKTATFWGVCAIPMGIFFLVLTLVR